MSLYQKPVRMPLKFFLTTLAFVIVVTFIAAKLHFWTGISLFFVGALFGAWRAYKTKC